MPLGYPLALPLGGGPDDAEVVFQAILAALANAEKGIEHGLDPTDPVNRAQAWAEAVTVSGMWGANRRLQGYMIPGRMMESLPVWEEACGLRPLPTDTDMARNDAVRAHFLGSNSNTLAVIYDVCAALAGDRFLGLVAASQDTTYLPGLNPGPPGFEWSTTRCLWGVKLRRYGLLERDLVDLIRRIRLALQLLAPAWNVFAIGTAEGGFVAGTGLAGITLV